mmetsp:Transcript_14987/g.53997  ORF Transcript_14987/g.53997 Transcript_14987/m.53997 type:complete len:89 (-) Transcript_14987:2748-3014(-)
MTRTSVSERLCHSICEETDGRVAPGMPKGFKLHDLDMSPSVPKLIAMKSPPVDWVQGRADDRADAHAIDELVSELVCLIAAKAEQAPD